MKPTFREGVAVAALMTVGGTVLGGGLAAYGAGRLVLEAVTVASGFGYALYLLARSGMRNGRITYLLAWIVGAAVIGGTSPSIAVTIGAHLVLAWLVRSLAFHASVVVALADLGLWVCGLVAAGWAWRQTGALAASLWCLWLVQAVFGLLPRHLRGTQRGASVATSDLEARFDRAARAATAALRALSMPR